MGELIPQELVEGKIFIIRGKKVMLGVHLAKLYGVETKVLMQAVKRNIERFPKDFMFQLSWEEVESWNLGRILNISHPPAYDGGRKAEAQDRIPQ